MTTSEPLRLKGSVIPRDLERYPRDDEDLGLALFSLVTSALTRGRPAPVIFLLSPETVDRFQYKSMIKIREPARRRLLGSIAGAEGAECMAILGAFRFRGKGPLDGQWVVSVFIEWPDNRWWTAWQPLGPTGQLIGDGPQIRAAIDGSPRPGGVGGWFAHSRRHNLRLKIQRDQIPVH